MRLFLVVCPTDGKEDIKLEKGGPTFFVAHSISNHHFPNDTWYQIMYYKFDENQRNCMAKEYLDSINDQLIL